MTKLTKSAKDFPYRPQVSLTNLGRKSFYYYPLFPSYPGPLHDNTLLYGYLASVSWQQEKRLHKPGASSLLPFLHYLSARERQCSPELCVNFYLFFFWNINLIVFTLVCQMSLDKKAEEMLKPY